MQVKELKQDGLSYELEVTVDSGEIGEKIDSKLKEYGKTMKLPGFRPGKVPLEVMKQRYGKAVLGEVLEGAVNDTSAKIMEEKGLKPALQPKIEVKEFDEGKDLVYTMQFETVPDFEIVDLKSLKLEKPVAKVDDKAIEDALENIAAQNRETEPVEGRETKKGDILVIDFHGKRADGVEVPGMHAHGQQLDLGRGQFIPGFEDQLVGRKAGEKVKVKVTFPEEYHSEELAGQDADFDVDIKQILEPKPQEINDELAKKLGLDDLEALKDAIRQQIENEYAKASRIKLKRQLLDILDEKHDMPVPQGMIDLEFNSIRQQLAMERQQDVKDGELQLDDEEKEELEAITERRVRLGMILSEIGRENNIQVTDSELQRAVISEAQKYPGQEAQVFEYYKSNQNALEALRAPVFEDKVVDFIAQLADVTEKEVSAEELFREDEEEPYTKKKSSSKTKTAKGGGAKKSSAAKPKEGGGTKKSAAKKTSSSKSKSGGKAKAKKAS